MAGLHDQVDLVSASMINDLRINEEHAVNLSATRQLLEFSRIRNGAGPLPAPNALNLDLLAGKYRCHGFIHFSAGHISAHAKNDTKRPEQRDLLGEQIERLLQAELDKALDCGGGLADQRGQLLRLPAIVGRILRLAKRQLLCGFAGHQLDDRVEHRGIDVAFVAPVFTCLRHRRREDLANVGRIEAISASSAGFDESPTVGAATDTSCRSEGVIEMKEMLSVPVTRLTM